MVRQPLGAFKFCLSAADGLDRGQFFQRADQVVANGQVVFNDVGSHFDHRKVPIRGAGM
jgi:hypothetical protein